MYKIISDYKKAYDELSIGVPATKFKDGLDGFSSMDISDGRILKAFAELVGERDVFCDVGCSTGDLIRGLSSEIPGLAGIVGIEAEPRRFEAAMSSMIESNKQRQKDGLKPIEIIHWDVAEPIKPELKPTFDSITVFYFYTPFGGDTFEAFFKTLGESLKRSPRTIKLMYLSRDGLYNFPPHGEYLGYGGDIDHRYVKTIVGTCVLDAFTKRNPKEM